MNVVNKVLDVLGQVDLSPFVPKSVRSKAKAIVPLVTGLVALAVQLTLVGSTSGAEITTAVLTVAATLGVHGTVNAK